MFDFIGFIRYSQIASILPIPRQSFYNMRREHDPRVSWSYKDEGSKYVLIDLAGLCKSLIAANQQDVLFEISVRVAEVRACGNMFSKQPLACQSLTEGCVSRSCPPCRKKRADAKRAFEAYRQELGS